MLIRERIQIILSSKNASLCFTNRQPGYCVSSNNLIEEQNAGNDVTSQQMGFMAFYLAFSGESLASYEIVCRLHQAVETIFKLTDFDV